MSNCKEIIWTDYPERRCSRKAKLDGYCKQHHPASVKKRQEDSERRQLAIAQREIAVLKQREIDLVNVLAKLHESVCYQLGPSDDSSPYKVNYEIFGEVKEVLSATKQQR